MGRADGSARARPWPSREALARRRRRDRTARRRSRARYRPAAPARSVCVNRVCRAEHSARRRVDRIAAEEKKPRALSRRVRAAFVLSVTGGSVFLAEDDADADAEVVLRIGAEVCRVVVELDGAEVNARADAEVEAAAEDSREAVVGVGEACDAVNPEARVLEAGQRVRERLDLRLRRVVLDLDAAQERVEVNRVPVEVLSVERVVALQPEVAGEVSGDRALDAVEAFAATAAADVNAVVREAAIDIVLVVVAAARGLRERERRGAGDE